MQLQLSPFADQIFKARYAIHENESWDECAARVAHFIGPKSQDTNFGRRLYESVRMRELMPSGRYLYSAGRPIPQISNCFMLLAEDNRESWADTVHRHIMTLSTGGGVGTEYSEVRPKGAPIKTFGGKAAGPLWLMSMVNSVGQSVNHLGRKAALIALLEWAHPDIFDFIHAKDWSLFTRAMKEHDFNTPAPLDQTNISIRLDERFFESIGDGDRHAHAVFMTGLRRALKTGEPGFTVDLGKFAEEIGRNPCGEVTSGGQDLRRGDCCNLGSVNLSRIESLDDLTRVTALCTELLFHGTELGWLPYDGFKQTRYHNRRIGVGLLGLHEWCLQRGQRYEPTPELERWLTTWAEVVEDTAASLARKHDTPMPVRTRAIAPTGTIGIVAETTTGIEPILSTAYKTRWLREGEWQTNYGVDPTARRMIEQGYRPDAIEDAYELSHDVERRLRMQALIQKYVDQGVSSTVNLPAWGEPGNNDAEAMGCLVLKYLPKLRGLTFYPDGSRAGQPLTAVAYEEAVERGAQVKEVAQSCSSGGCGA